MADGPDIFGFDDKAATDPWAQIQAQRARLGRGATPPLAPDPVSLPGDVDSLGRRWVDRGGSRVQIDEGEAQEIAQQDFIRRAAAGELTPREIEAHKREQTFEEMAQEQAAQMDPEGAAFQQAASAQQANALSREFGIPFEEAMQLLGARVQVPSRPNPKRPIVEGNAADQKVAMADQRDARVAGGEAQVEQERGLSELLAQQGLRNDLEMAAQTDRDRLAAERIQEQSEAVKRAEMMVQKSSKALREQPDVDPNRLWNNSSTRDKFLFAMGGLLSRGIFGGLFGRFQDLHGAIQDDIDAQKANIDKRTREIGAAVDDENAARGTYQDILAGVGDERAADLIYEQSRLEAAKADYQAKALELGIPITEAHVQQTLAEFDQAIAQAKTQLDLTVAATPRRIGGGTRPAIQDKDVRALLRERGKQAIGSQADFAKLGVTEQGHMDRTVAEQRGKLDVERAKAENEGDGLKAQQRFDQRKWVTEKTQPRRLELNAIRKFREKYGGKDGDIPGKTGAAPLAWVGLGDHQMTAEARAAKEELTRVIYLRLRPESGAAISDAEVMRDAANLVDGMTEEDVWRSLETREQEAMESIDLFERAPEEEQVEQVLRGQQPEKRAITSGNVPDPTVRD